MGCGHLEAQRLTPTLRCGPRELALSPRASHSPTDPVGKSKSSLGSHSLAVSPVPSPPPFDPACPTWPRWPPCSPQTLQRTVLRHPYPCSFCASLSAGCPPLESQLPGAGDTVLPHGLCPWSLDQSGSMISVPALLTGLSRASLGCGPHAIRFKLSSPQFPSAQPLARAPLPCTLAAECAPTAHHLTSGAGVCSVQAEFQAGGHHLQGGIALRPSLALWGRFYSRMFSPKENTQHYFLEHAC